MIFKNLLILFNVLINVLLLDPNSPNCNTYYILKLYFINLYDNIYGLTITIMILIDPNTVIHIII